jgi:hypothetical protein
VGNLTTFVVESAKLDDVDEWERDRLKRLRADAEIRRQKHRVNAGRALQAMRLRGESIAWIAQQPGVSTAVVRGFLQAAASDASAGALDGEVGSLESTVSRHWVAVFAPGRRRRHRRRPLCVDSVARAVEMARIGRCVFEALGVVPCVVRRIDRVMMLMPGPFDVGAYNYPLAGNSAIRWSGKAMRR